MWLSLFPARDINRIWNVKNSTQRKFLIYFSLTHKRNSVSYLISTAVVRDYYGWMPLCRCIVQGSHIHKQGGEPDGNNTQSTIFSKVLEKKCGLVLFTSVPRVTVPHTLADKEKLTKGVNGTLLSFLSKRGSPLKEIHRISASTKSVPSEL